MGRAGDVLAHFDGPDTSNGPGEAINGRLEHLRGFALGFRNLTHSIAGSLLETGASDPFYTVNSDQALIRKVTLPGHSRTVTCEHLT